MPQNVIVIDGNGNKIDSLRNDVWYTIVVRVDYTNSTGWSEFTYQITSNSADRADSLIKDICMLKEFNA